MLQRHLKRHAHLLAEPHGPRRAVHKAQVQAREQRLQIGADLRDHTPFVLLIARCGRLGRWMRLVNAHIATAGWFLRFFQNGREGIAVPCLVFALRRTELMRPRSTTLAHLHHHHTPDIEYPA